MLLLLYTNNMERGRGSFRPVRLRGGFRGVERGRFISRGRRPFRGFQIRNIGNCGSPRGGGQFLQANRHLSNEDLRNKIHERKVEWAKDSGRNFDEIRFSHDSSDAESVSSEYDASSARYSRQHVSSDKEKESSNSPLLDQVEKVKCKERTPIKKRVYADSQHLKQDVTGLSEGMKRQTLNDPGELTLVTRIGRQGHIQRGLPRFHGPRGDHPVECFQKRTFYPRGRGYTSHTFGRFDDRTAPRRDDSRERAGERTLRKEPKVKKQQASWIPMEDEEEMDKEKPVSLQSVNGPTEKKKGLATEKDLITLVQSKGVLQRETDYSKLKPIMEQKRKQKQSKKVMSLQEDAYSELPPSEKDSSDFSEAEEGNKNNSSKTTKGHDQERNTLMQEKRYLKKELPVIQAESGSGLRCCRGERNFHISGSRIEHVSEGNSVGYRRRSGSLERDEHSWIGLEGKWKKSLSDQTDDCMKKDESTPDMNYLKRGEDETQLRNESSSFILARPACKFTLGNRGDISKSLLESVRSSSKEGDDLYRSGDESQGDDIYRKELEEALQAPSPSERDKRDYMEPLETPENYSCREDNHVSRREDSIPKGIHSSSSKQDPGAYISSTSERGKVHFKIKCYGMLNNRERCTANTRMIDNCRSESKDRTSKERRESNQSRSCSREFLQTTGGDKKVCGGTDTSKRYSLSESGDSHDWSDSWKRYSVNDSKKYNKNILDSTEQNMTGRRGNASDGSHLSDQDGQLSSNVRYMAKTRDHEISQTIEKHILHGRESANDNYHLREKDSVGKSERDRDRLGLGDRYSVTDIYRIHNSSEFEDCDVINNSNIYSRKSVPKHVKMRQNHNTKSDSSTSSFVSDSESDIDSDHDKLKHNKKRRMKCPQNLHQTDGHTSGHRQRLNSSHSSESHSEDERQIVSGGSESLESYSRKKHDRHRKPRRRHSRERKEHDQFSTYSSERSESRVSYSRSERKYHKRSKSDRRYAAESNMSNYETSDSSRSYSYSSRGYHDYTRQKPHGSYRKSDSWEGHSARSESSDNSDSSDSYTWNRRDRSSSRERCTVDKRDRKGDGSRFSDVHRSSSRDGSRSSPFKSPTSERRCKYKDSNVYGERSKDYESPMKILSYAKRYPQPRPRVGYGRHIFPYLRQSPRSRSRSVSVARSKVSFYEKFKNKSKCWVKAQADLIKEAEKKLMQESISNPPSKRTGEEKENTVDLVKATKSLQITVEHVRKESISVSQDAVILQEHITMSKSSNSDQSPKKKSHCHLTMKEHKLAAGVTSSTVDVVGGKKEIEMVHAFKDSGNWISKVTKKEKQEMKGTDIHEGFTEPVEWNSRQVFTKETNPTKPVDKVNNALHSAYDIPDENTINENSSVDEVLHVKGSETSKTVGSGVQNTVSFQTIWKKKISSKPGIKVILAGKTVSSTSSPKKSFWNDRQKRRLNKGFRSSPVRKTAPTTELSKTPVSRNLSGPLQATDQEVTELTSKERIPQKKLLEFQALKSTDKQLPLSLTPQSPNVLSKNATAKVKAPLNPAKEKIIDTFKDKPSIEVSKCELKQSMKVAGFKGRIQADARRKEPDLNIPLPISRSTSPDKSSRTLITSEISTNLSSSHNIETLRNRSMKLGSDDVHVSDEKKMVSDKSDGKTSVFIRDKTETSHSDHEEVDMDLVDEEPDISLEEDTSWMGREQDSSSNSFSDQISNFMPGSATTAFTSPTQLSPWGPGFGTYPPFLHQYIPMGCPPQGYGGNWFSSQNMHYGYQQYWAQQAVDETHREKVAVPDGQTSQTILKNSATLSQYSHSAQDSSLKDSLNTSPLQSQQVSASGQASWSPILSPVQPTKDQTAFLVNAPPVPPEDPVPSSEVPPLPEDPYPFPLPHLTPVQPPNKSGPLLVPVPVQSAENPSDSLCLQTPQPKTVPVPVCAPADKQTSPVSSVSSTEVLSSLVPPPNKSDPLLVSVSVQPKEDPAVSLYLSISQPATVSAPVPAPVDKHTSLVSLVPSTEVVPSPVPPPKDHVCLPVPPPKETMPSLVSPAGRAVTLPILSPGESVLSLMPAPVLKSKEIPSHVSPLTSAPVVSPQKSLSVISPLTAHVPTPVPASVQQSKTSIPAPVQPPKLSPNITGKGTTSIFRQDVVSSLIPPLQHTPVSVDQNVSLKQISVPLPVPPPQEWSSEKISAFSELCLPENPAATAVPNRVTSPQQSPTQQSNFALNQSKDSISEVKSSSVIQIPDLSCIYGQKSEPSPPPLPQKSPTMPNTEIRDHMKKIPLVVSLFRQPKTATPNQSTHQSSLLLSVPTLTVSNKSHQKSLIDVQMESAKHQHLSQKKVQSSEMLVRGQSKDITCSSGDNGPNTIDLSPVDMPQSPSLLSRDPRLQRRALETKNNEQGSELLKLEPKIEPDRNPHPIAACVKATQKRPQSHSVKPKRKTSHQDAQSKCLKQLKSILKSSLAKSSANSLVPKKLSKPKIHEPGSLTSDTRSSKHMSCFDSPVPNSQETCQKTLNKPQTNHDADYTDVPMDIDETENSNPELVSNQPVLPETKLLTVFPPKTHGAPVSIPTSLPYDTASNTANSSNSPNKPSRDPRLQVQSKKYEAETRKALKTLFKVLQRPQSARMTTIASERLKPVAQTDMSLQRQGRSSQGTPTGPGSTSQTFEIVESPERKKPANVAVVNPKHTENKASTSRLKPQDLFPVSESRVSDNAFTGDNGGGTGKEDRKGCQGKDTVVKEVVLTTSSIPVTSSKLVVPPLPVTVPVPVTPSLHVSPSVPDTVTPEVYSNGASSDVNAFDNCSPFLLTPRDDEAAPNVGATGKNEVLDAPVIEHKQDWDDTGQWLAEPPVPKETQSPLSVKPLERNVRSASDQGIFNKLATLPESSPSDVERSPVYPSTSFNQQDMKRGSGVNVQTLSSGSDSHGLLSTEKIRGMSHKDVSEWVKKSTAQCLIDPETTPLGRCHSQGKKRHGEMEKRRHHSGSSGSYRLNSNSGVKTTDSDRAKIELGGKPSGKSPKGNMRKFLSHEGSPRGKEEFSRSKSVDNSRWAPEISNPLGSYRIPKLNSAATDTPFKESDEDREKEEKNKKGASKTVDESSDNVGSDSDDDLFNETPAFLKEFEETRKTILAAGMMPGSPDNTLNESMHSDDSLVLDEPTVSYKPMSKSTDGKSTISLDALLAEKVENEVTDRELNTIQKELKEGIKLGGFVRLAEAEREDDSDDELLPEHHQKLQYFQVSENTIQDQHPGDLVLHPGKFPCLYSEVLSPVRCGFRPSESFLEKHLANIHPDALTDLLTTDMLSICFHKITAQEEILRWIFFIMSVHQDSCVIQGCKKLVFDIIHTQLSLDETSSTWAPSVLDILKVLVNFGGETSDLLQAQTLFSQEDIRAAIIPENDDNLTPAGDNTRSYAENVREFLQTVAFALQGRPQYTVAELNVLLVMMAKTSLEKEFTDNVLLYEFSVLTSSILPCYKEEDWTSVMPSLCYQLSELTSHHHNFVYLAQLFPHGKRGSSIQRRLAYLLLMKMLQPDIRVTREQLVGYKLHQLSTFFPALRELAADDLYALSSAVALLDIAVGNEHLKGSEKNDLQHLMELLRTLTSDVRDNVRRLDHTRVKDLMVRISSKWTVTLQTTTSKQRNLFAWTKQKSPQKMQVQRLETGASDVETDEEEDEDEECPDEGDAPPENVPDPMDIDIGAGGDANTVISVTDDVKQDNDIDIESGETSSCPDEDVRTANVNNNADVDDKDVAGVSGSSAAINSEVRVVLEDICGSGKTNENELSSDEESLPELDITL